MFSLSNKLGSGSSWPKCSPQCQLGIHLGPPAEHAQNVCLVLNSTTGLVSPQYNCQFDEFFESVRFQGSEVTVPTARQCLSKLTQSNSLLSRKSHEITAAEPPNTSIVDSSQGEANIFEYATNNIEPDKPDQDPLDPNKGTTGDDEPTVRQTRGRLLHQHYTANMRP